MASHHLSYREIIPNQYAVRRWKDINVDTGAAQSTLQDIKLPERARGFTYRDSNRANCVTRNRFIYWKIIHDQLELTEQSLDYNLHGNQVRFRFRDTPILDGVSVHETNTQVIVLVPTVCSVHRLIFTHPNKLQRHDFLHTHTSDSWPSVFADASAITGNEASSLYVFELTNNTASFPHSAASWLSPEGDAVFAIASHVDRIAIVRLPRPDSHSPPTVNELRHSSVIHRFWTGIIPSSIRGGKDVAIVNVVTHSFENELFVFGLSRDSKIRQWSCNDYECVMVFDVMDVLSDTNSKSLNGPQNHMMRKALGTCNNLYLGLYLCFVHSRHICVLRSILNSGQWSLELTATIQLSECHLLDFCLSHSHVWALWSVGDSDTSVHVASIEPEEGSIETWTEVTLELPPEREFSFPIGIVDPREAFMERIFAPGNFSIQAITKAIGIYRRSSDGSCIIDVHVPINVMKEEVTLIVEKAIQSHASEYEMQDAEYFDLQLECWSKFYSCCVQYQEVETKIMGLVLDPKTGLVCIIKKAQFSLLRLQDSVELLVMSKGRLPTHPMWLSAIADDRGIWPDLGRISQCLSLLDTHLRDDVQEAFECDLMHQHKPQEIVTALIESFLITSSSEESSFISQLSELTNSIGSLLGVVEMIFGAIDLAHGRPETLTFDDGFIETVGQAFYTRLFASDSGCSLMAKSVHQMARLRFRLCCNLLFYFHLLIKFAKTMKITPEMIRRIENDLIPQISILLNSYFVLVWASETVTHQVPRTTIETGLNQLAMLNITENPLSTAASQLEKPFDQLRSLVEVFVRQEGGTQARSLLAQYNFVDAEESCIWNELVTPVVQTIAQLLWPVSVHFAFPEFLLLQCQYMHLFKYIRLLHDWCEWNCASRNFLMGNVYLNLGEPEKSLDWFFAAPENITREEFLFTKIIQPIKNVNRDSILTTYYLKVIHLLEQFGLPSQATLMATTAISVTSKTDENLAILWCIVFKHQLDLEHYKEAYEAIVKNPDKSRKKDCLRQLVVVLCERKEFNTLVEFQYDGLQDDLVNILESRARAVDLITHNFYDVLYSFHVYRGNYRKAGSIMYEYGMRLGHEVPGLKGLQRQAKCYLTTLNSLRLVDPNYAWIVKPVVAGAGEPAPQRQFGTSPKRDFEGDQITNTARRQMKVLELSDIEKEYDLLHARLHLFRKEPELTNVTGLLSPSETVGLLISVGLFDGAIRLCRTFDLRFSLVFEGLTTRCVELSRSQRPEAFAKAWDWLTENDLTNVHSGIKTNSADHAWALLEKYLKELEAKGQSLYHRCIATKMLTMGAPLPLWLTSSYKRVNATELLCLYLDFDVLEDACQLCIGYLDAVLGVGKEYFGLVSGLHATCPPVWVPYTLIDHLLDALSSVDHDPILKAMEAAVISKLDEYEKHVESVSEKMIAFGKTRQQSGQSTERI